MDNMPIKSKSKRTHIDDLEEAFVTLWKYRMKLNLAKYAFRMTSEKFLGFIVSSRRIEGNLEKIKSIQEMIPLRTIKEVQCLTKKVAALNRFVLRSVE